MKNIFLISIFFLLASCRYDGTFLRLKDLKDQKIKVEEISDAELTTENQKIIRDYFGRIKDVVYEVKNSSNIQNYTHRKFFKFFQNSFCTDFVLDNDHYSKLMAKCKVSGFYICSEEVRSYEELLKTAKSILTVVEFNEILENEKCANTLNELGVTNE